MQTILRSGFGLSLTKSYFETLKPNYIKNLLKEKGFILVKGFNLSREECLNLSRQYGTFEKYILMKRNSISFQVTNIYLMLMVHKTVMRLEGEANYQFILMGVY
jgi:hypothetical protein